MPVGVRRRWRTARGSSKWRSCCEPSNRTHHLRYLPPHTSHPISFSPSFSPFLRLRVSRRYATLLSSHEQQAGQLEQHGTEKMEADLTALREKMEAAAQREALEQQVLALSEREALLSAQRQADQQVRPEGDALTYPILFHFIP